MNRLENVWCANISSTTHPEDVKELLNLAFSSTEDFWQGVMDEMNRLIEDGHSPTVKWYTVQGEGPLSISMESIKAWLG